MFKGRVLNHRNIYIWAMFALAASLPLWPLFTSISILTLLGNWILEGNFKAKFKLFFSNRIALVLTSLFLLHLIGLLFTSDFNYALKDLRVKSPILALPLIVSSSMPLNRKLFNWILNTFVFSVFAASLVCFAKYLSGNYQDIRDISVFISHIRYSLMLCFVFFICMYWLGKNELVSVRFKVIYILIAMWLLVFMFVLESFTGISILLLVSFFYLFKFIVFSKKANTRIVLIIVLGALFTVIFYNLISTYNLLYVAHEDRNVNYADTTALGNRYVHDTLDKQSENGYFVLHYISEFEMSEAWNKRSKLNYHFKDNKGQYIRYTLMRFLTSKGYRKDAEGVNKLTEEEVTDIENGIANCTLAKLKGVKARIYELLWEFKNFNETGNPNAHSMMLRILFWDASIGIIKDNFFTGVGTGDMNIAFEEQYAKVNSPLDMEWRLRSHNQYLSVMVGFGVLGLCWFLFTLFYPLIQNKRWRDFYYLTFFIIMALSMVTEDTIESQPGVVFFAFFNSFLLLSQGNFSKNDV